MDHARATVAVFRPDDDRLADAVDLLESLGADAVADPMLAVAPTGAHPRPDADFVVFTSTTGVELAAGVRDGGPETRFAPGDATVCAIGESTADALRAHDYPADLVPDEYTSSGLVAALEPHVDGARVEVARSDHGSAVLLDGLEAAGAYVHETVLYRLTRPEGSGVSAVRAASGDLDGACFTSTLTVEHFLDAAADRGVRDEALAGLNDAVVGAIGPPTADAARQHGIDVDVVPDTADFEALACDVVDRVFPDHRD
jgi:uroporphyrinogen-III synthase